MISAYLFSFFTVAIAIYCVYKIGYDTGHQHGYKSGLDDGWADARLWRKK
jgi:hypothetical protein